MIIPASGLGTSHGEQQHPLPRAASAPSIQRITAGLCGCGRRTTRCSRGQRVLRQAEEPQHGPG